MTRPAPLWRVQDFGDGLVEVTHAGVLAHRVDTIDDALDEIRAARYRGSVEIIEADGYARTERI